jgi:hypothetical protein
VINKAGNLILPLASWIIILGLPACGSARTVPALTISASSLPTKEQKPLASPYAQLPAAGMCASFEGGLVIMTLNPGIPDPRCSKVKANQKLEVTKHTPDTLQVRIGSFQAILEAGGEVAFETTFRDYLAEGVHHLDVAPCCGPELWLEAIP